MRFECARCSACCRHDPGYVFLGEEDLAALAEAKGMSAADFIGAYCRWVDRGEELALSLREKPGYDCVFWEGGCAVYGARPLQCRSYPFWPSIVGRPGGWEEEGRDCPGIGRGREYSREEAEALAAARASAATITRARA